MSEKVFAPSVARNSRPILAVLREEFAHLESILEIGSGTGQHAVCFAAELDHLTWQCSDVAANHADINAWLSEAMLPNVRAPVILDTLTAKLPTASYDGVYSANTAHIMSLEAVAKMFALVGSALRDAGSFVLYGPFRHNGTFNSASNAEFHHSLRRRDSAMGIRHLEVLDDYGNAADLERARLYAMPANNHIAVWIRNNRRRAK